MGSQVAQGCLEGSSSQGARSFPGSPTLLPILPSASEGPPCSHSSLMQEPALTHQRPDARLASPWQCAEPGLGCQVWGRGPAWQGALLQDFQEAAPSTAELCRVRQPQGWVLRKAPRPELREGGGRWVRLSGPPFCFSDISAWLCKVQVQSFNPFSFFFFKYKTGFSLL